ncbi:MAG: DUF4190 domain-containing protein, partial [Eubacterium sp.]|nr:DUF4190 domain-containing protein [Eubacterium sp.]
PGSGHDANRSYNPDSSNGLNHSCNPGSGYDPNQTYSQGNGYDANQTYNPGSGYAQNGQYQQENPYQQNAGYGQYSQYQQNGYGQQGTYSQYQQYQKPDDRNQGTGFGIASMILGILSLMLFCTCMNIPLAVAAVIFGILQYTKGTQGRGMALAGMITAALSVVALIVTIALMWGPFMQYYQQELNVYDSQGQPGYEYDYEYDIGPEDFFDFFDGSDYF